MGGWIHYQFALHKLLPALVGQSSGDQQITPICTAERDRLVQSAQMPLGQHECGDLNALDVDGIARLFRENVAGQPGQGFGHLRDVMRKVRTDTAPYTLGNVVHDSRSHTHHNTDNPTGAAKPGRRGFP